MPEEERNHESVRDLLFIDENKRRSSRAAGGRRRRDATTRMIMSHARRTQTGTKHKAKEASAQQGAVYARSFVGWNSTRSSSAETRLPLRVSSVPPVASEQTQLTLEEDPPFKLGERGTDTKDPDLVVRGLSLQLIPWQVGGGLRMDPFNSFPTESSRPVMHMVDYHIHVWTPMKSGAFDDLLGFNTHLDLCWPLALQDDMLFDATVAVSRVAWCLNQKLPPVDDPFVLKHRGMAISRLRRQIPISSITTVGLSAELIFTIGRMISMAYMANEYTSFGFHLNAFRNLVTRYIAARPDEEISRVMDQRLRSWEAVESFRAGSHSLKEVLQLEPINLLASSSVEDNATITRISQLPSGFSELASSGSLSLGLIDVLQPLNDAAKRADDLQTLGELLRAQLFPTAHELCRLLVSDLPSLGLQVSCALAAFIIQICQLRNVTFPEGRPISRSPSAVPDFPMKEIAQAFTNKRNQYETPQQRNSLIWGCVVLSSLLLAQRDQSLKGKGHVIFISLTVLLEQHGEQQAWDSLEPILRQFLWHDTLAVHWRSKFEASVRRQKRWEDRGYLAPGVPHGAGPDSLVEYFVLREARGTLPRIEDD